MSSCSMPLSIESEYGDAIRKPESATNFSHRAQREKGRAFVLQVGGPVGLRHQIESIALARGMEHVVVSDSREAIDIVSRNLGCRIVVVPADSVQSPASILVSELRAASSAPPSAILTFSTLSPAVVRMAAEVEGAQAIALPAENDAIEHAIDMAVVRYEEERHHAERIRSVLRNVESLRDEASVALSERAGFSVIEGRYGHKSSPETFKKAGQNLQTSCNSSPVATSSVAVRSILKLFRLRNNLLDNNLVDDSAWQMLMELFLVHREGQEIGVTALCTGVGVPVTTALRRLGDLESSGFVVRKADLSDRRRVGVFITQKGLDRVVEFFDCTVQALRVVGSTG